MPEFPQFQLVKVDFNCRYCTLTENSCIKTRNYTQWHRTRSTTLIPQKYDDDLLVKTCFLISTDRRLKGGKARQFALKRWKCLQNCSCINLKKALLYNWYRVTFPSAKRPGRGDDHPPPRSKEVKEKELYVYSPSGPSRPLL